MCSGVKPSISLIVAISATGATHHEPERGALRVAARTLRNLNPHIRNLQDTDTPYIEFACHALLLVATILGCDFMGFLYQDEG